MKHSERIAPVAAMFSALASVGCCLPLSIPAAVGLAGLGVAASRFQPWLIGLSFVLLAIGIVQLSRPAACRRRSRTSLFVLCVAAAIVLTMALFPQSVASFVADRLL